MKVLDKAKKEFENYEIAKGQVESLCSAIEPRRWSSLPLVVLVDDIEFCVDDWSNFLWLTFTRSNPATDIYGASSFIIDKHWGTKGPLVIDARFKPHNAPPLIESKSVNQRVDQIVENHPELNQIFN